MDYIEIAGAIIGLLYLYLEYKASIYLWFAGIIMPAIYIYVFCKAGLYADMGINIYYLGAALYGWLVWLRGRGEKEERRISRMPRKFIWPLFLIFIFSGAGLGLLLTKYTDSTVPYEDAFITALSMIAMWMLAYKYVEQWLVWLVVDVACCALYVYKGLYPTTVLYGLYAVIAVFGYLKWKKLMIETDENLSSADC